MASCQILCHALRTVKRREKKKKDLTDFFFSVYFTANTSIRKKV